MTLNPDDFPPHFADVAREILEYQISQKAEEEEAGMQTEAAEEKLHPDRRPARWAQPHHPGETPNGAPRQPRRLSRDVTASGDDGRPGKVTHRDLRILEWIGRFYGVTPDQVQWRFGIEHRSTAYRRLQVLKQHRLVSHRRIFDHAPGVYSATKAGLTMVDSPLKVPRFTESRYLHELDIVDCAIEYERDGHPIVTEREIRLADTPVRRDDNRWPQYAVWDYSGSKPVKHYPDLVVRKGASKMVVEVEHARKRAERVATIIRAYLNASYIDSLQYVVTGQDRTKVLAHAEFLRKVANTVEPRKPPYLGDDGRYHWPDPFTRIKLHSRIDEDWGYQHTI